MPRAPIYNIKFRVENDKANKKENDESNDAL
jgi:hypothetical protein